jgi:flagellar basal body-associated protein FliL
MAIDTSASRRSSIKLIIALLLVATAIASAVLMYQIYKTSEAPTQPTTETRPNSDQNSPGRGNNSVTEGGDESDPMTPSSTGTGNNTELNPAPGEQ